MTSGGEEVPKVPLVAPVRLEVGWPHDLPIVAVALWFVVGAAVGVLQARHGHWRRGWVRAAIFGPFAIPLALQQRHLPAPGPVVLTTGSPRQGEVDMIVGIDGSGASTAAADLAVRLLGQRVRRVTLAAVLDLDIAAARADMLSSEPWPEERSAREDLEAAVARLRAMSSATAVAASPSDCSAAVLPRWRARRRCRSSSCRSRPRPSGARARRG